jgi:hypothetical protein
VVTEAAAATAGAATEAHATTADHGAMGHARVSKSVPKQRAITIENNGRCMSLAEFDRAMSLDGNLYELGRGVIEVREVPRPQHLAQLQSVRNQLVCYKLHTRAYRDKAPEYLEFGINEYWIVDAQKRQMTAMTRWRGQWKSRIVKATQKYSTRLLPGFSLDLGKVLAAAK